MSGVETRDSRRRAPDVAGSNAERVGERRLRDHGLPLRRGTGEVGGSGSRGHLHGRSHHVKYTRDEPTVAEAAVRSTR